MRALISRFGVLALAAAIVPACGGGGGGGGGGGVSVSGKTINLKGGTGSTGAGGNAGDFDCRNYRGTDLKILKSGTVNSNLSVPIFKPYLGDNPLVVTSNTTLGVGSGLTAGSTTVTNTSGTVTGIWVHPGVTLTIQPNFDTNGSPGTLEEVRFQVDEGIYVEGTIKIALRDGSPDTADLRITSSGAIVVTATGKIDLSGANNPGGTGADGGTWFPSYPDALYNAGTITTKGGDGRDGGRGGAINIRTSYGAFVNTGTILADGGSASVGTGGDGGGMSLYSNDYSYLCNHGLISSRGGDGPTGGGSGGQLYLYTSNGAFFGTGTLRNPGGNATSAGDGGDGGGIYAYIYGQIRLTGTLDSHGGNGAGGGDGGDAGYIDLYSNIVYSYAYSESYAGGIWLGADVDSSGGNGANGGDGWELNVYQDYTGVSAAGQEPVVLVGYSNIQAQGGNGATTGGNGGYFYAEVDYDDDEDYYDNSHAGSVENQAAFDGRGGNGGTGAGGYAGSFEMYTTYYVIPPYDFGARNSGDVNLSGGNGTTGGDAGYVEIYGKYYATNTGNFTMVGGNGTTGNGGDASSFYLYCDGGTTLNTGTLTSRGGGSPSGTAMDGGYIWLAGSRVVNSGSIASNGGNSTSGTAGNGGDIELFSQDYPTQTSLSSLNVNPGTGPGSPNKGTILIDGIQVVGP
jgi:hypothetical protein